MNWFKQYFIQVNGWQVIYIQKVSCMKRIWSKARGLCRPFPYFKWIVSKYTAIFPEKTLHIIQQKLLSSLDFVLARFNDSRALDKREYLMINFLISHRNHMLWSLIWTVLLRGHNIHFYAELTKIILNYHQILPLIRSSVAPWLISLVMLMVLTTEPCLTRFHPYKMWALLRCRSDVKIMLFKVNRNSYLSKDKTSAML